MLTNLEKDANSKMAQSLLSLEINISKIRTGRASPGIIENIQIKYFDSIIPLKKLSNILVEDSSTLIINVFDYSMLDQIKKSIIQSNLGLNPIKSGKVIRVVFPSLTEDRRKSLIKLVRFEVEQSRISIRTIRRDFNEKLKSFFKSNLISKDNEFLYQNKIQKMTNRYIKKIELILLAKEKELMKI